MNRHNLIKQLAHSACPLADGNVTPEQPENMIALGYGVHSKKARIRVRRMPVYDTLKLRRLDADASSRQPWDKRIVSINQGETVSSFHLNDNEDAIA